MRLKNDTNNFAASFNITPPYQMLVLHSKMLIYPRELYQRGVQRKRVEMIAADFNEYVANEPKVSFRNGKYYVVDGQHTIEGRILRNGGKDLQWRQGFADSLQGLYRLDDGAGSPVLC